MTPGGAAPTLRRDPSDARLLAHRERLVLGPVKRWLILSIGLAAALGAAYALLAGDRRGSGAPLDRIDDASRARLERVLEDAER